MKNIVICCDGTGNEFRASNNTNVVKIYRALKKNDPEKQIAYYDPGVGTISAPGIQFPPFKFLSKLMGLVFGFGLSKNLVDSYTYLMKHYHPGDRIFLFGFSRGAYTARALAGMLKMCGLLNRGSENLVPYVLKIFKKRKRIRPKWAHGYLAAIYYLVYFFMKSEPNWALAGGFKKTFAQNCPCYFIGVWDTVKSIGWFRRRITLPFTFYNPDLQNGCHAVSIDEKRSQYRTNLWGYKNSDKFKEVWFAGVHSDIGGSYPETGLSDISLGWMIKEAKKNHLIIDNENYAPLNPKPLGKLHNPLLPFWWVLGWKKRRIRRIDKNTDTATSENVPWIHQDVKIRMEQIKQYRPGIPSNAHYLTCNR